MGIINLTEITPATSTNQDGLLFFDFLRDNALNDQVVIRVPGHLTLSSSFLNSSIGKYIDIFGLDKLKKNLKILTNKNVFIQLKNYIELYNDLVK